MLPADARVQTRQSVLHTYNTPPRSRAHYSKPSFLRPDHGPANDACLVGEEDTEGRRRRKTSASAGSSVSRSLFLGWVTKTVTSASYGPVPGPCSAQ